MLLLFLLPVAVAALPPGGLKRSLVRLAEGQQPQPQLPAVVAAAVAAAGQQPRPPPMPRRQQPSTPVAIPTSQPSVI